MATPSSARPPPPRPPPLPSQISTAITEFDRHLTQYHRQTLAAFQSAEFQSSAQAAASLADHIDRYITIKAEEMRGKLKESLGRLGEVERGEVVKLVEDCGEEERRVRRLAEEVKAVREMEDLAIGGVVEEMERLGGEVEELKGRIEKETFPVRITIGYSPPNYFLIFNNLAESMQIDGYLISDPQIEGLPSRVVLTQPLVFLPVDLYLADDRPFYTEISLCDRSQKRLNKKPFKLSSRLLRSLPACPAYYDFSALQKEQQLLQNAFDVFYERYQGKQPKVGLNVYDEVKRNPDFGVGEIVEEMERLELRGRDR